MRSLAAALVALVADLSLGASLTTIHSFSGPDGRFPEATMILASDGYLYGTTLFGGTTGRYGTAFRVSPATNAFQSIVSFEENMTANIGTPLTIDSNGNLYGTSGGDSITVTEFGSIYRLETNTYSFSNLFSFTQSTGNSFFSGLLLNSNGTKLYGETSTGGTTNNGTIYEFNLSTNEFHVLYNFSGSDGKSPQGGLISDSQGNLYGVTSEGGDFGLGTVFRLNLSTNDISILANFDGTNGSTPWGGLLRDQIGNIFGTTYSGGAADKGTVFKIDAVSNHLVSLAEFDGTNGMNPFAGVIIDSVGNLFGVTSGGNINGGTAFRIDAGTNNLTTLVEFHGFGEGANPRGGLVADNEGNLFGTTFYAGDGDNAGTIFKLTDAGYTIVPEASSILFTIIALLAVGSAHAIRQSRS